MPEGVQEDMQDNTDGSMAVQACFGLK